MAAGLSPTALTARQLAGARAFSVIDFFALALSHALLVIAGWRLVQRTDLDADPALAGEDEQAPGGPAS
jgi:hypothetical protein